MNNSISDFPYFSSITLGERRVYMDFAATTPKPRTVIESINTYYQKELGNPGRGSHSGAHHTEQLIAETRRSIAQFFSLPSNTAIQFTSNATYAINTFAYMISHAPQEKLRRIIVSAAEHHSNFLPWQRLAHEHKIPLHVIPITPTGDIDYGELEHIVSTYKDDHMVLALTACSNVTGIITDKQKVRRIADKAKNLITFIDFTQLSPHAPITFEEWGAQAGALSLHKMYGPEGVGALFYPLRLQHDAEPFVTGGGMINKLTETASTWNTDESRFEAGTPHTAGIVASKAAIDYILAVGFSEIAEKEERLATYFAQKLSQTTTPFIKLGKYNPDNSIPLFSITGAIHSHDIASFLDLAGISVRAGNHCASLLHQAYTVTHSTRFSLSFLNTTDEIDYVFDQLDLCVRKLK